MAIYPVDRDRAQFSRRQARPVRRRLRTPLRSPSRRASRCASSLTRQFLDPLGDLPQLTARQLVFIDQLREQGLRGAQEQRINQSAQGTSLRSSLLHLGEVAEIGRASCRERV